MKASALDLKSFTRPPSAEAWRRMSRDRDRTVRERMMFAVAAGLVSAVLFGEPVALAWTLAVGVALFFERRVWTASSARVEAGGEPLMLALSVISFVVPAVYGGLSVVFWREIDTHGDMIAALFLAAIVLSSVVNLRQAPMLAAIAATPTVVYMALGPLLLSDDDFIMRVAGLTGLVFLVIFTLTIAVRLAQADAAEAAALAAARQASAEADVAHQATAEFLTSMSRELRTPMSMVLGATAYLRRADLSTSERAALDSMIDAGDVLVSVLNDILDAARIEAGDITICPARVSPAQIAARIVQTWRPRAEDKWLEIFIDVDPSAPDFVVADPVRIKQILFNLISNAVRYTDHGGIRVQVSTEDGAASDSARHLVFRVIDTGRGLTAASTQAALEGRATTLSEGGGFSVALCRKLARAMGGDIIIESTRGEGSVFTLKLPLKLAGEGDLDDAPDANARYPGLAPKGLRVLVADAHSGARQIAASLLSEIGAEITQASDGREALGHMAATRFDLVLLDVAMPNLDMGEVTRQLSGEGAGRRPKVIAMSALAEDASGASCQRAGLDGFLAKPLTPATLFAEISAVLDMTNRRAA